MLDKQPDGKRYEQKNWYHLGSPLFSRKEGRVPRYDRALAPAAFLSLPYEGSRIYSLNPGSILAHDPGEICPSQTRIDYFLYFMNILYLDMSSLLSSLYAIPSGSLHISRAITDSPSHQLAKSWSLPRRPI